MGLVLLIILIVLIIAAIPTWPYSRDWGYSPFGILAIIFIILLILVFTGVLTFWDRSTTTVTDRSVRSERYVERDRGNGNTTIESDTTPSSPRSDTFSNSDNGARTNRGSGNTDDSTTRGGS